MRRKNLYRLIELLREQNMELGTMFNYSAGDTLDRYGENIKGMKRKRWFIFKESDRSYKARLLYKEMVDKGYIKEE